MSERVLVNGARIEESFLAGNVAEARTYVWRAARWEDSRSHGHCMVCNVALSGNDACYQSNAGWLCPYCFETFVKRTGEFKAGTE